MDVQLYDQADTQFRNPLLLTAPEFDQQPLYVLDHRLGIRVHAESVEAAISYLQQWLVAHGTSLPMWWWQHQLSIGRTGLSFGFNYPGQVSVLLIYHVDPTSSVIHGLTPHLIAIINGLGREVLPWLDQLLKVSSRLTFPIQVVTDSDTLIAYLRLLPTRYVLTAPDAAVMRLHHRQLS